MGVVLLPHLSKGEVKSMLQFDVIREVTEQTIDIK